MKEMSEVVAVLAKSDPVVLVMMVALAAIGLAAMSLWVVVRMADKGERK